MSQKSETVVVSKASERAEAIGGVLIAFFAAIMAMADLYNSNLEEEMIIAVNKTNSYSSWYQSKSIKESLKESELATLESIRITASPQQAIQIDRKIVEVKNNLKKYGLEKTEILLGSANVPKEEQVQDLNGEIGKIIGVKEWEATVEKMDIATQKFDIAMLFFQISLVLGAVCVIIYDNPKLQKSFIILMLISGVCAFIFSFYGYSLAN